MKKITLEEFIERTKNVYGDRYDYSLVENINYKEDKIKIICYEHGIFEKIPYNHIHNKKGCLSCKQIEMNNHDHNLVLDNNYSYIIGLFQSDGTMSENVRNRGNASIFLSSKDEDIIYKIKDIIPYNSTIDKSKRDITIERNNKIYEYKDNESINISIHNQYFRKFLFDCGVPCGKKSKIVSPPLYLKDLSKIDYVRGLYDGDGSLGFTDGGWPFVSFVTISSEMASFLLDYISELINQPRKDVNPNNRDKAYNIVLTREDAMLFCEKIYYKDCLSMNRKYHISEKIKSWIRPLNMKKIDFQRNKWTKDDDKYIMCHSIENSIEKLNRTKKSIKVRLWRLNKK